MARDHFDPWIHPLGPLTMAGAPAGSTVIVDAPAHSIIGIYAPISVASAGITDCVSASCLYAPAYICQCRHV